jgi:hypothetical protein
MKPGRRSQADLTVVPIDASRSRPSLTPICQLKSDERRIFDLVARENVHLTPLDTPMLTGFVRASAGMLKADSVEDFEKLSRVALSFATRLRLTPQSRMHPRSLARRHAAQQPSYFGGPLDKDE